MCKRLDGENETENADLTGGIAKFWFKFLRIAKNGHVQRYCNQIVQNYCNTFDLKGSGKTVRDSWDGLQVKFENFLKVRGTIMGSRHSCGHAVR